MNRTLNGDSPLRARLRLWRYRPRSVKGPVPAYTREQIADAAIAIADAEGLDAVTMRRVAQHLGTGAMSLYRYVENKDILLELVADRMYAHHEWPVASGRWRQDFHALAHAQRAVLLEHPWLLRLWSGWPMLGPNVLRHFERTISILDGFGLDIDEMVETTMLLSMWVDGHVRQELEINDFLRSQSVGQIAREMEEYVRSVVDSGDYPYFARFVKDAMTPHIGAEERFERALARVLAGIEATLPAKPTDQR